MKKDEGTTKKLDANAAAFQPAAPVAPAPVAVVHGLAPAAIAPPAGPHIIDGMQARFRGDEQYLKYWPFATIRDHLRSCIAYGAQFPVGPITVTGGVHENFGDAYGAHYSIKDANGISWHVYPFTGHITAG